MCYLNQVTLHCHQKHTKPSHMGMRFQFSTVWSLSPRALGRATNKMFKSAFPSRTKIIIDRFAHCWCVRRGAHTHRPTLVASLLTSDGPTTTTCEFLCVPRVRQHWHRWAYLAGRTRDAIYLCVFVLGTLAVLPSRFSSPFFHFRRNRVSVPRFFNQGEGGLCLTSTRAARRDSGTRETPLHFVLPFSNCKCLHAVAVSYVNYLYEEITNIAYN